MRWMLAAAVIALSTPSWSQRMLTATPSILRHDSSGYGEVALSWRAPAASWVQIRIGAAEGEVFAEGGPFGRAATGHWVTAGTRFFLQNVSAGEPGMTLASLTIRDTNPRDPAVMHYIAVGSTSYNPSNREPAGAILLFDRETADQIARIHFPWPAWPAAVSADGATLYVAVSADSPGIAIVDVLTGETRGFIPIPRLCGRMVVLDNALLAATFDSDVALIDLRSNAVARTIACPGRPEALLRTPGNGIIYGLSTVANRICVITPELQAASPIVLPKRPNWAVALEDTLLVTTLEDTYRTSAIGYGKPALAVPSLDGFSPVLAREGSLYAVRDGTTQRFSWSVGPGGEPVFTAMSDAVAGLIPGLGDDRFVYAGISGYCSTLEGPVMSMVGFRMLDPLSLAPVASVILARESSFGLFGMRALSLGVAASVRVPPRGRSLPAAPTRRGIHK